MVWTITILTFLASLIIVGAVFYALSPSEAGVAGRLSRLFNTAAPPKEEKFSTKQKERVRHTLASIGKIGASPNAQTPKNQLLMVRAGYRSPEAMMAVRGFKILVPVALVAAVFFTGAYTFNPFLVFGMAVVAGYLLPDMWLTWRVRARQRLLRRALPDGLDLLVICVEAGLGLDQALLRVAQELNVAHPELSEELQLVNLEMRVGKTRLDAMRELARRTGLDDIKALVSMLIQTERFGTSVAQSLRVHSDDLRMKRRQRAEEMAAKTTVKMVPALVFFIFPALMVVILGPAIIAIMRQLMPNL
ncbi:MAG: tight adherence protein [Acidobacteriaceae bacterium]|nr:tight adherence protein [Acidobacteriaceae bacterium]